MKRLHSIPGACSVYLLAILLQACASSDPPEPITHYPEIPAVGTITLQTSEEETEVYLDVGISVFTNTYHEDESETYGDWIFTEIRDNERHFLPYLLRDTLLNSGQWGAVRVLPQADPSVDLLLSGTILYSDGSRLVLAMEATDSTGRRWLQKTYADDSRAEDYPDSSRLRAASQLEREDLKEPFQDIYNQVANDLLAVRNAMTSEQLQKVQRVSELVYANDLAPDSFAESLATDAEGYLTINTLPAEQDPMMNRVLEMRRRHHLFIDTVDEYYKALFDEMQASYLVWRRYAFDQENELEFTTRESADQDLFSSTNTTLTLLQRYDRYRWAKIYEQEFLELATGFNKELAPTFLELNRNVHGLSGTMEEQYLQWRRILRQLFELETGDI
ncbi:MAG: hypothetical protein O2948_03705 [Proteobacteria bacterium]|nr:hypothetical protein [Pseudomonadota bacterium]MDA0928550.1 hypothetical protein [Pseudomonadota bacterium]